MKNCLIQTSHVCKTFTSSGERYHAIRDVSITLYEGEFTVIMGSSGSGKSTLLYLLSGMDCVTEGEVIFDGHPIQNLNEKHMATFRRKNVGFVFQAINLVPTLTISENISLPGYLQSKDRSPVHSRTDELMKMMQIENLSSRLPSGVSGGQQQRAAIARGLINRPRVLFADEPTGSLNSQQGIHVLDTLSDINRQSQTIVMVTHDVKAASRADRILFIRDGKIDGDIRLEKYLAENNEARERQIVAYLTEKGW